VAGSLAVYSLDLHGRGQSEGERFYLEKMGDYSPTSTRSFRWLSRTMPGMVPLPMSSEDIWF
jgi:hypothetical protein